MNAQGAWADNASKLQAAGYRVVPIEYGSKGCIQKGWPDSNYTGLESFPSCGVGIITSNCVAIDVDALDEALVTEVEGFAEILLGPGAPRRIGKPPKSLLLYRVESPWKTRKIALATDAVVELRGDRAQFVAHHTHPETHRPYHWTRQLVPHAELPLVTHEQLNAFAAVLHRPGSVELVASSADRVPRRFDHMGFEAITDELQHGTGPNCYDDWLRETAALRTRLESLGFQSSEFYDVWHDWSKRSWGHKDCGMCRTIWDGWNRDKAPIDPPVEASEFPDVAAAEIAVGDAQIEPCELPPYLVDQLIEQDAEVLLYGPQGSYKSLFAIELGVCIATGTSFFGHGAKRGLVVYLAGEGCGGVKRRVRALKLARSLASIGAFAIYDADVRFDAAGSRNGLRAFIEQCEQRTGEKLALLVIDTYSRYAPAASGKKAADESMYDWLRCVKQVRGDATVLVVHHTGHDGGHARGTSAWNQGTDTVFRTEGDKDAARVFLNEKQKDGAIAPPMAFRLHTIDTGYTRRKLDGSAEPITSVALEPAIMPVRAPNLGKNERIVYNVLRDASGASVEQVITQASDQMLKPDGRDTRPQRIREAINGLTSRKLARADGTHLYLASDVAPHFPEGAP